MARRTPKAQGPAGYEHVGDYHGIEEYLLTRNGLRVLFRYDDTAPVVGLMVTYLVGSRHEAVGYTGATHLLEHLMFRGSKAFPPLGKGASIIDQLEEKGAMMNASTWLDRTNYYEVLPDRHFEYVVMLEADRMRHAIISEKDRAEEMPAVRSEYAMRVDNVPEDFLDEKVWATAFMAHPYHHPTIGWQSDFENVSIERLQHFYDEYYWPNNAVVSVIGPIPRDRALTLIATYFGRHPRSPHPIHEPYTVEPKQTGKRFVEVKRSGTKNLVSLAFKVPEALHTDTPVLLALGSVLGDGQTSRLYRALVEKRLCQAVRTVYMPFKDPSLMQFVATLAEGVPHEKVERLLWRELTRLQSDGVTKGELARIVAQIRTEMAFARDGHYATLSALNEAIAVGDWRFFFNLPAALDRVTTAQVRAAARTYLQEEGVTIGYYRSRTPRP
jgi:zinc protease